MEEILTVLPFGATMDLVQLRGSTIKKAFEHSIRHYGTMSGEFLQVSGSCCFTFDLLWSLSASSGFCLTRVRPHTVSLSRDPRGVRRLQTGEPARRVLGNAVHPVPSAAVPAAGDGQDVHGDHAFVHHRRRRRLHHDQGGNDEAQHRWADVLLTFELILKKNSTVA